jgi:hypothetical protein
MLIEKTAKSLIHNTEKIRKTNLPKQKIKKLESKKDFEEFLF